jgi:ABC-2 type transport system ATP-binding protein
MRPRLDLGASLVGAPRLPLLDEPPTGLDPRGRTELWDAIRALVDAGTDVLLTTRHLDEADHLAGQVVISVYVGDYNIHGPHRALKPQSPQPRKPPATTTSGEIERRDRLGGLIHEYYRTAA